MCYVRMGTGMETKYITVSRHDTSRTGRVEEPGMMRAEGIVGWRDVWLSLNGIGNEAETVASSRDPNEGNFYLNPPAPRFKGHNCTGVFAGVCLVIEPRVTNLSHTHTHTGRSH